MQVISKRFLSILFILLVSYHCFSQVNDTNLTNKFSFEGFNIKFPSSWTIDSTGIMGTKLIMFAALEDEADKFRENVNIIIQDLKGQDVDFEKYKQISETQIRTILVNGKIIQSVIYKSGKEAFYKINYEMTQNNFRLNITSLCYMKKEQAYLATFTCESAKYEQYKKLGEAILNTFSVE